MSNVFLFISLLCLNTVQMFLLLRYVQMSRDLADCKAFKDAFIEAVTESLTEEEKVEVYV